MSAPRGKTATRPSRARSTTQDEGVLTEDASSVIAASERTRLALRIGFGVLEEQETNERRGQGVACHVGSKGPSVAGNVRDATEYEQLVDKLRDAYGRVRALTARLRDINDRHYGASPEAGCDNPSGTSGGTLYQLNDVASMIHTEIGNAVVELERLERL